MILYKKASFKKSVTQKTYRLMKVGTQDTGEGDNFLGFSRPRLCVNLRPDDGALVNTRGFKAFDLGGGIVESVHKFENRLLRIFQHNERSAQGSINAQIVVTDENHDVYVVQPGVFGEPVLVGNTGSEVIAYADFRQDDLDIGVLTTFSGLFMLKDGKITSIEGTPSAGDICAHKGRLFAVRRNEPARLWFSDVMDVTNWNTSLTEGGYIDFDMGCGAIKGLISMGEYLYCTCENSIWRVTAYGDQRQFSVQKIADASGRIANESVCLADSHIYYMTEVGFFKFDGWNVQPVMDGMSGLMPYVRSVRSVASSGREVIFALILESGGPIDVAAGKVLLLRYDVYTGEFNLSQGYPVRHLLGFRQSSGAKLLAIQEDVAGTDASKIISVECAVGNNLGVKVQKFYQTGSSDLGVPDMKKLVRKVTVSSNVPVRVSVTTDRENFDSDLAPGIASGVCPKISGRTLALKISTDADEVKIVNPTVSVDFHR